MNTYLARCFLIWFYSKTPHRTLASVHRMCPGTRSCNCVVVVNIGADFETCHNKMGIYIGMF